MILRLKTGKKDALKPQEFRFTCVITQETPYLIAPGVPQGVQPGKGILHIGRVVWLENKMDEDSAKALVSAYAEGIGVITIDPSLLTCSK